MKKIIVIVSLVLFATASYAQQTLNASTGHTNYQWYKIDTGGIMAVSGATASSFLPNSPGIYYATFDGTDCGKNASEYYVLTANGDSSLTLNANQMGVGYQWYKDNNLMAGATNSTLNIISTDTPSYYQTEVNANGCNKQLPGFHVFHMGKWFPLPVELIIFDAVLSTDETKVLCNWKTKTEINTDYFTVERSLDQLHWEFVGQLSAAGNSNVELSYQTYDYKPYKGRSYYRLKTTDIDNSFVYSQVEPIFIGEEEANYVRIYPNPFTDKIVVEGPEDEFEFLGIYNAVGQIVRRVHFKDGFLTNNKKEIDVSGLAQGVYFLKTKNTYTKILKKD